MPTKFDEFMSELRAFDEKMFDEMGGDIVLAEIAALRERARNLTPDQADGEQECPICRDFVHVERTGNFHRHGPRYSPCQMSGKPAPRRLS